MGIMKRLSKQCQSHNGEINTIRRNVDKIICLGDTVGYGANPNECLEYVKKNVDIVLCGNHDSYQIKEAERVGGLCGISTAWTEKNLKHEWLDYIQTLPISYSWQECSFYHTVTRQEGEWTYLNDINDILSAFSIKERVCFYGHTHRPRMTITENGKVIIDRHPIKTSSFIIDLKRQRAYVNPGSIGQQRDHKTDLSFAICEQDLDMLKVDIERHRYCAIKTYIKIKHQGCGDDIANYLIREQGKRKLYKMISGRINYLRDQEK